MIATDLALQPPRVYLIAGTSAYVGCEDYSAIHAAMVEGC